MKQGGFTLVEIIIAIAIVALVAVAVVIAMDPAKRIGDSQDSRRWADLVSVSKAVELYTADYGRLPSNFSTTTVGVGSKVVLCSSSATLTCDGQSRGCLVVNDTDFLGVYLPDLPIDPSKSADSDTGYYVTRASNGALSFGACDDYLSDGMELISKVTLPSYTVTCGDGLIQDSEVCDDGNTSNEQCGDGVLQLSTETYCNSSCTSEITFAQSEVCDYIGWSNECYTPSGWYTTSVVGKNDYCKSNCLSQTDFCQPPP